MHILKSLWNGIQVHAAAAEAEADEKAEEKGPLLLVGIARILLMQLYSCICMHACMLDRSVSVAAVVSSLTLIRSLLFSIVIAFPHQHHRVLTDLYSVGLCLSSMACKDRSIGILSVLRCLSDFPFLSFPSVGLSAMS